MDTETTTFKGMEFTVRMDGYTLSVFEEKVIEAAARQMLDHVAGPADAEFLRLRQQIQEVAIEKITNAAEEKLANVSAEILGQTVIADLGEKSKEPLSLGEYIGIAGRDFLTTRVKGDGEPAGKHERGCPRIDFILSQILSQKFAQEMQQSTNAMMAEVRAQLKTEFQAFVNDERFRIMAALNSEIKARK